MGLAAHCAHHLVPVRRARRGRAAARRAALRGDAARGDARICLGCVPLHAVRVELEYERPDPAGDPDLGLLALELVLGARSALCALRLDEVRRAPAVASLGDIPRTEAEADAPVR